MKRFLVCAVLVLLAFQAQMFARDFSIAVFVPGTASGSPTYEMLISGVRKAAEEEKASVKIVEGGFNQADWPDKLTSLAAMGEFDLIVTSNPAMPEICSKVGNSFPKQKFLILDGYLRGNSSIATVMFNQYEQGYLAGYMAGLIASSSMKGLGGKKRAGMIAGQEYQVMNDIILPGFKAGALAASGTATEFRVVGNWYDASKGTELANVLYDSGVDVILCIAGGANQGVIASARAKGKYVLWFDYNGYKYGPGIILGSTEVKLDVAAYRKTKLAAEGSLLYGKAEILGVKEGYVGFADSDPAYVSSVPRELRNRMTALLAKIRSGALDLKMPGY